MTALVRTAAPAAFETTANMKQHMRIDISVDDGLVDFILEAAVLAAEEYTQRRFVTQTWEYYLDDFPHYTKAINLPYPPLQSVTSVQYKDPDTGSYVTWNSSQYVVDTASKPARIVWAPDVTQWPVIQDDSINGVKITFVCGYGAGSVVPTSIRHAVRLIASHLYEHREDVVIGTIVTELPKASEYLLHPHKVYNFV